MSNDRGHYGSNGQSSGATHWGTRLGAEAEAPGTVFLKFWAVALFGVGVIAAGAAADALAASASARWSRVEDEAFRRWLKAPAEERRRWPEERAAWAAWEHEAQRIDDEVGKAAKIAAKAAKKRLK